MSIPTPQDQSLNQSAAALGAGASATSTDLPAWLSPLCHCLVAAHPSPETLSQLRRAVGAALAAGATPFEAIVGTPLSRYGARLTFSPGKGDGRDRVARALAKAFGLSAHPWGPPDWVSVRATPEGVSAKAYHRPAAGRKGPVIPSALLPFEGALEPIMLASDHAGVEIYLRQKRAMPFGVFAETCLHGLGETKEIPTFSPLPRPRERAFGLSLKARGGVIEGVCLYAHERSLPADSEVQAAWKRGMSDDEARDYERALAGARSTGRLTRGSLHAMLAWSFERGGGRHRAASLRLASPPRPQ